MTRPRRTSPGIVFSARTYPTLEGEVLKITAVGEHPSGYSNLRHVIMALTNEQALDFINRGYNVRIKSKDTKFFGEVLQEHLIYLVIDIPEHFDENQLAMFRLERELYGTSQATLEVIAQAWRSRDDERSRVRLYLDAITIVEKPKTAAERIEEERQRLIDLWATGGPLGYRPPSRPSTVYKNYRQVREAAGLDRDLSQREFELLNHRHITIWEIGDTVGLNGEEYVVGNVTDLDDQWGVRLDLKFKPSAYMRVPK